MRGLLALKHLDETLNWDIYPYNPIKYLWGIKQHNNLMADDYQNCFPV